MSVLRSSRYNPGSVYSTHPNPPRPSGLSKGGDEWDHRPSTESLRDDKVYVDQHDAYPPTSAVGGGAGAHYRGESSGTMLPPAHGAQGGNRDSRYEDAYDERGAYEYEQEHDQGQGQGQGQYGHAQQQQGYAGHQGEGYGYGAGGGGGGGGYR
jgi:hypothetical protein